MSELIIVKAPTVSIIRKEAFLEFNAPGVVGPQGLQGPPGPPITLANSAEVDVNVYKGQVLSMLGTGHLVLAEANDIITSNVCGLAISDYIAHVACTFQYGGSLQIIDWTNIVGSSNLSVGANYYVSPATAGMLTTVAPTTIGQYVIKVGFASAVDTLEINIEQRILL